MSPSMNVFNNQISDFSSFMIKQQFDNLFVSIKTSSHKWDNFWWFSNTECREGLFIFFVTHSLVIQGCGDTKRKMVLPVGSWHQIEVELIQISIKRIVA